MFSMRNMANLYYFLDIPCLEVIFVKDIQKTKMGEFTANIVRHIMDTPLIFLECMMIRF